MKNKFILFIAIMLLCSLAGGQTRPGYILLKTGIHFDSKVSGGSYTMSELGQIADSYGLDAAIITDHDNMKVSYGIQPFESFLKLSIEENSISKYGTRRYFDEVDQIDRLYKDIIFIAGVEAVPYYYWRGSPFYNNLMLKNWHTHLLVMGLNSVEAYEKLPSIPNGLGYKKPADDVIKYIADNFAHFSLILLYFIFFLIAFFSILRRSRRRRDIAHITKKRHRYRFSWKALLITLILGYALYQEFPFLPLKYTQYQSDAGVGPFQELIDYVEEKNGLVFWAHPEVSHEELRPVNIPLLSQTIKINTDAYYQYITEAQNYTGYAIFWEGIKVIGKPGGLWDVVLEEYINGYRKKPVWALGELDFEESNKLSQVTETNTFIFARERSRAGIYEALRTGRMYSTRQYWGNRVVLDDFAVYDMQTEQGAFLGETLLIDSYPVAIHVKLRALEKGSATKLVSIFKNEELLKSYRFSQALDEWFVDREDVESGAYYRLFMGEPQNITLVTNPVFVRKYR